MSLRPAVLLLGMLVSAGAAAISLHVFVLFGVVPGAELLAVAVSGGLGLVPRLRRELAPEQRLLVQTAAVTATTGAALGLALPLGLATAAGHAELLMLLLVSAAVVGGVALASHLVLFDSALLPADAPWSGARALAVQTGSQAIGGLRAIWLLVGLGLGHAAGGSLASPVAGAFGLAFLGNAFGLGVLAIGLIVRPTLSFLLRADVDALLLPHGLMIGAAAAGLAQVSIGLVGQLLRRSRAPAATPPASSPRWRLIVRRAGTLIVGEGLARKRLMVGAALALAAYTLTALLTAVAASDRDGLTLVAILSTALVVGLLTAAFQVFAGLSGSRLGWVPTLGGALAVLAVSSRLGQPPVGHLIVVALALAAGPLFAELGFELKAARVQALPGLAAQQVIAGLLGLAIALAVVGATHNVYYNSGFLPPASIVLATALELLADPTRLSALAPWVLVGFAAQWLGGASRHVGLLFGTGLLIGNPSAGWALLAGLAARTALGVLTRGRADLSLAILGLGAIAGELLRIVL